MSKNESAGKRMTRQRQEILNVLIAESKHLTAKEVYNLVQTVIPRVSLATVYRNLELLTTQGKITKIVETDGTARFEVNHGQPHHHYFTCLMCGNMTDIPCCPMSSELLGIIQDKQLTISGHSFQLFGYCPKCKIK